MALVFAPLAFGAVYPWTFLVVQALVTGVVVLWAVRLWGGHKPKLLWPPLAWAVTAFVLYAVARYFTADIEYVARLELIRILLYAFLFLAVINQFAQPGRGGDDQLHADGRGGAGFVLRGGAISPSLEPRLEFDFALSGPRVGNLH